MKTSLFEWKYKFFSPNSYSFLNGKRCHLMTTWEREEKITTKSAPWTSLYKNVNGLLKDLVLELKLRHCEKATKLKKKSLLFWCLLRKSAYLSKQAEDFLKILWPFQKSWTLLTLVKIISLGMTKNFSQISRFAKIAWIAGSIFDINIL